ncbi:hypothetical protein F01_70004 [Burkholderia cenocepacia]|nr:hypothetical protein F01_70004 [Burkholderia cenocepacia]
MSSWHVAFCYPRINEAKLIGDGHSPPCYAASTIGTAMEVACGARPLAEDMPIFNSR